MDTSGKDVIHYTSEGKTTSLEVQRIPAEMTTILEASMAKARALGYTKVCPLDVIGRIIDLHSGILCRDCLRCKDLKLCISDAINKIRVTRPAHPAYSKDIVPAIRMIMDSHSGDQVSHMEDVKKLFVYMLNDPTVRNAIEEAGFSISVIKNNVENGGTVCKCRVEEKEVKEGKSD